MKEISEGPSDKRSQELCRTRASFFSKQIHYAAFSVLFHFMPLISSRIYLFIAVSCCSMFLHFGPGEGTEDSL